MRIQGLSSNGSDSTSGDEVILVLDDENEIALSSEEEEDDFSRQSRSNSFIKCALGNNCYFFFFFSWLYCRDPYCSKGNSVATNTVIFPTHDCTVEEKASIFRELFRRKGL